MSWCIIVGIVAKLQAGHLENQGLIPARGKIFISSPKHPHQLWAHPSRIQPLYFLYGGPHEVMWTPI